MIGIGETFPEFEALACVSRQGPNNIISIRHDSFPGKWLIVFFWPKDFTPVCASELFAFTQMASEFEDRDAQILGVSIDSEYVHLGWVQVGGSTDPLAFPMVSDLRRQLSSALGILDQRESVAQRATFIVDPAAVVRHISVNDFSVGRNPKEILRILDALQTDDLCPSNWERGAERVSLDQAGLASAFR